MVQERQSRMAGRAWQHPPREEDAWWREPGEGYWRALLEQGEVVPEPAPPADPQHSLYPFIADSPAEEPTLPPVEQTAERQSGAWEAAREALVRGEPFQLTVVGANRGGLLVEWNDLQGFVPASHLKETPQARDPKDRASALSRRIGESLTLCLIEVDDVQGRLVFSERAASGVDPSPSLLQSLRPGDVCRGRILNLTSFGAFVDLGGVEGLIHVSEISWDRLGHPADLLHSGDEVQVQVLGVNPEEGRVALSLKRLRPNPWVDVESRYHVGQIVEGLVTNVVSFGVFVRLEEGLEGLIHLSELAEGSLMHPRNVVHEGDTVRVRVLSIDPQKRRIALSLRWAGDVEPPG
jgi:small subunit ribosomal protein S1